MPNETPARLIQLDFYISQEATISSQQVPLYKTPGLQSESRDEMFN